MAKKKIAAKTVTSKKIPNDVNQLAHHLGRLSTKDIENAIEAPEREIFVPEATRDEISRVMAALGRKGGKVSGSRRMASLTQEQRSQIAFKAAQARWSKKSKKP